MYAQSKNIAFFSSQQNSLYFSAGIRGDGTALSGNLLMQFKSLRKCSFIVETTPRNRTPPPFPKASSSTANEGEGNQEDGEGDSAWEIGPEDILQLMQPTQLVINMGNFFRCPCIICLQFSNPGCVKWLYDDSFCDFSRHHLSFNINVRFTAGSFSRRVMYMMCPDHFCGPNGPAPAGHVSLTVMSNHSGGGIQYHNVPASFLTPANPTRKGEVVLVLQGALQGRYCSVFQWKRKERLTVLDSAEHGRVTLSAGDVCLATPSL
jgi:hypothetical protein